MGEVMEVMVMADPMGDIEDMAMARGRLRPPLMLSLAMDTEAMADLMAAMEVMVMADPMVDMDVMAMARGRLRPPLMLSLAMDMAAMEDLMEVMEVMVMADPMVDMEDMVMADPMVDMAMESKPSSTKPFSSNQLSCFN